MRIWDLNAGRDVAVFTLDAPASAVAYVAGQRVVIAGDQAGGVHFLELVDSSSA